MYTYFIKSNNLIKFNTAKNIKEKIKIYEFYNPSCELLFVAKGNVTDKINKYINVEGIEFRKDIHAGNGWFYLSDHHLNRLIVLCKLVLFKDI